MKPKFFLPLIFFTAALYSCKPLEPVTVGGVEKPKLNKLSKEGIDAEFGMKLRNPNNMRITVFPSEFDGTVNGIHVGKIKLYKKVRIKANSDQAEIFFVKSDFTKLGFADLANLMPVITSGSATLSLKGELKAGKWYYRKKFPVNLTKTLSLKQQ